MIKFETVPERGSMNTVTDDPYRLKKRSIAGLLVTRSVLCSGTAELLIYNSDDENALAAISVLV
ncbi:hypothetical protein L0244_23375 [bacterium]|nr:hypothetical protein [bacterium]